MREEIAGGDQVFVADGGEVFCAVRHGGGRRARSGVRRDAGSLVAKLRAEGRQVEVIDCNQVLLDYLHHTTELQRAIRAEKRHPVALKEFGLGEVPAEDESGSDYLFLGVEKARRYRGTYL